MFNSFFSYLGDPFILLISIMLAKIDVDLKKSDQ